MQCIFEEEIAYPGGRSSHSKCINKADILIVNDPCYGLCYQCAYQKVKIENERLKKEVEKRNGVVGVLGQISDKLTSLTGEQNVWKAIDKLSKP